MNNDSYSKSLELIRSYSNGISIDSILNMIAGEEPDYNSVNSICSRIASVKSYPDTIHGILLLMNGLLHKRKDINGIYELAMEKYSVFNSRIVKNKRSTEDEIKIKGTLSDYILKIESSFENHDRADETIISTLGNYLNESNLHGKTDIEILYMNLSPYLVSSVNGSLDQYAEIFRFYHSNQAILNRLINISNLILEESQ